jgi:hypothetical protein
MILENLLSSFTSTSAATILQVNHDTSTVFNFHVQWRVGAVPRVGFQLFNLRIVDFSGNKFSTGMYVTNYTIDLVVISGLSVIQVQVQRSFGNLLSGASKTETTT